ncbi:DUF664 domain-containing protein [Pseudonocardia sp. KRD-184]|uniref:DUF664 domain-containing protein n=1 Tax=Pseudonocardia oceani TaxID=2792013 RepID=A0ABS6UCG6_9PSEU|nr:DUF664 domain-containing protein [Pseudonocardia oceani]MBW0091487.1 DUF664 domain-containing protein [Pseudonocardia oceani]MBW0098609.1 DUF664 domain-containing protein [Pseudonocardia oceani]MBW0111171.1 DUF664 domain-containing protein [Pseudonocardia oceani]MBW0125062.1 DUF664 domain-containing protein [Pseudonocardia oceani]MBW0129673.1 DUF664 domain-containing protein [Pseudonocardia oceani]
MGEKAGALCVGGIVRHVAHGEEMWTDFIASGEKVDDLDHYAESFRMGPDDTVAGLLDDFAAAARRTDEGRGARRHPARDPRRSMS